MKIDREVQTEKDREEENEGEEKVKKQDMRCHILTVHLNIDVFLVALV